MVQMLVSVMCRKASKKRSRHHGISDDPFKLAAGLRMHKSEKAFSDMAEEFEQNIEQLDVGASMNKFFVIYGAIEQWTDVVPGLPVKMNHLKKRELARHLDIMHLTLGNRRKSRERSRSVHAQQAKARGRWNVLSTLLAPEDADEEGSAIARKLRTVIRGGHRLRLIPPIASLANVLLQKQEQDGEATRLATVAALVQKQDLEQRVTTAERGAVDCTTDEEAGSTQREKHASTGSGLAVRKRRPSAALTLLDKEARDPFHVSEGDSLMKRVAKLSLLEDEFASVTATPKELKLLWNDADNNGNGDLSLSEWQGYAGSKFNVLSSSRANRRAFSEAASAGPPAQTSDHKAGDGDDLDAADSDQTGESAAEDRAAAAATAAKPAAVDWKETLGALSMPILNRSNFRKFLTRTFEYNKCHYAFEYLDSATRSDRVDFEEYVKRRKITFKILDVDMEMAGSSPKEEFEALSVDPTTEGLDTSTAAEKHVQRSLGTNAKAYISFNSLSSWYRRALDGKLPGKFDVIENGPSLEEIEDASGLLVDIDVFCDLVLKCHYKTRSAGGPREQLVDSNSNE